MRKLAIGIDIGGTRTKLGLVDLEKGEVLEMLISPTETKDSDKFLEIINSGIDQLKTVAKREQSTILGVGFGVTGFVFDDGMVDSTYGFLDFMEDYPLSEYIEKYSSLSCRADNDARVVALGEALYGIGKGQNRVLVLTLGTGLGLGFIANGKFETSLPYAHMGGHISVGRTDFKCYCGKKGCLEALVSATGIVDSAKRMGWEQKYPHLELNVQTIFKAEQEGNVDAKEIVTEFLAYLKTGIDNYINLFAPDMIIIGGGVSKGMKPYLDKLTQIDFLPPYKSYKVKIALSELDEHSGILGSAALFN
ncbi:MAG: ROK family protein [Paludibacter sp.]|nr:ROK family protein [Paludibacter sp.]